MPATHPPVRSQSGQCNPAILIPVYNHGNQLGEVIEKSLELNLPIYVIDDGSTDTTAEVAQAFQGITLLSHPHNMGKGQAILTGLAAAAEHGHDIAITIDGDGQHNPADAYSLLKVVEQQGKCLVIGCRRDMAASKNVPWTSRFGRGFSNFWVYCSGGPMVSDSQSGFRLYPVRETLGLSVLAKRYQFEVEVLVKARRAGIKIREAEVGVVYQGKGIRVSHFRPWRDFLRNSSTFSRLIFQRILGIPRDE